MKKSRGVVLRLAHSRKMAVKEARRHTGYFSARPLGYPTGIAYPQTQEAARRLRQMEARG